MVERPTADPMLPEWMQDPLRLYDSAQMLEITAERDSAIRDLEEALAILKIALPGPRPWETESVESKLRIYRNMAKDRYQAHLRVYVGGV